MGAAEQPDPDEPEATVRVRIGIAYDGTGFSGWAEQPGRRTVAGVLAEALGRVLRLPDAPRLTVAGRTDAGVHARGQVAHVDVAAGAWLAAASQRRRPAATATAAGPADAARTIARRLASALPPDVRVRSVELAAAGFDARFSALWRRYSYRVCDDVGRADPLRRNDTLWHFHALDITAMNAASATLLGEHDFAAFCKRRAGATTVRALRQLDWRRDDDGVVAGRVVADAFCHNMVRSLVGALLPVGEGTRPPSWPAAVLAAGVRDPSVRVAPPHGLCLEEVRYPADSLLAERAAQARQVRVLGGQC
ncbi:MAG TPA: tRNA pseudouridine(38-40) synthase TruA [Trebonia sp.]|nr:tRNA pseudouridine(38-40) synthase TruA [Trebonia sp.]